MRILRLGLLAICIGLANTASAQLLNASDVAISQGNDSFDFKAVKTSGWSRIYFSCNPSNIAWDDGWDTDDELFNGVTLGWLKGFNLTKKAPLYMEAGVGIQYRTDKDEDEVYYDIYEFAYAYRFSLLSLNIPANLLYRFNVNDDLSISPYFGLDFRFNVWGRARVELLIENELISEKLNLFDVDDMVDDDAVWNRFQAGWHIGVGMDYRMLHLGIDYGTDFNEIFKYAKMATTSIVLGVNF